MAEKIEISKPCKLTSAQHIALMATANNGGIVPGGNAVSYDAKVALKFLGLLAERNIYDADTLRQRTAKAWADMRSAVAAKDRKRASDLLATIQNEKWDANKTELYLTKAADEYLANGRVVVTLRRVRSVPPVSLRKPA